MTKRLKQFYQRASSGYLYGHLQKETPRQLENFTRRTNENSAIGKITGEKGRVRASITSHSLGGVRKAADGMRKLLSN